MPAVKVKASGEWHSSLERQGSIAELQLESQGLGIEDMRPEYASQAAS